MTVIGRDMSNYDNIEVVAGFGFVTHKATEGTTNVHSQYGPRMNKYHDMDVPVLGSYHVVRTPGGSEGSLAQQCDFWFHRMDQETPWWRKHPAFMLQIDAEKWPYDSVSASTIKQFAQIVSDATDKYVVTYASRGQYGDSLAEIVTDLWNADYRHPNSYPGDNWVTVPVYGSAGWAPYSGKVPKFLQWTDTPYDEDAFRGTQQELINLVGRKINMEQGDQLTGYKAPAGRNVGNSLSDVLNWRDWNFNPPGVDGNNPPPPGSRAALTFAAIMKMSTLADHPAQVTMSDEQLAQLQAALAQAVVANHDNLSDQDLTKVHDTVKAVFKEAFGN